MLYNVVFQDNIYILLRQIDTINSGLKLDLDATLFGEKIVFDIAFFDKGIKKLFREIVGQSSLPTFIDILQSLHFSISKYLELLTRVCEKDSIIRPYIVSKKLNLPSILKEHKTILKDIEELVAKNDMKESEQQMVSKNELLELLSV